MKIKSGYNVQRLASPGNLLTLKRRNTACFFAIQCFLFVIFFGAQQALGQQLIHYVQPMAGTAPATTLAAIKHSQGTEKNANTIPAVTLPFAMTQWTPQTRQTEKKCVPPYFYTDSLITGFRASHWLSGSCTQDYGSFTIVPVTGTLKTLAKDYALPFAHSDEKSSPAHYEVDLPRAGLTVEISATLRSGFLRISMHASDSLYLLVLPNSDEQKSFIKVNAERGEIWGYNPVHRIYQGSGQPAGFNGWFYMKIEKATSRSGVFSAGEIFLSDSILNRPDAGAYVGFALKKGEQLRVKCGTSFSSLDGAKQNLQQEIPGWDFDKVVADATQAWESALSQILIETNNEKDKRIFYTSLYHALQHPRLFSDVDGTYPRFSGNYELEKIKGDDYYDDFSMWDIYRAQLPMLEILQPGKIKSFARSLILKSRQGGWLPIFPCWNSYTAAMIGDHSTAFIAAAVAKGIYNDDISSAYAQMRKNAFEVPRDLKEYKNGMGRRALPSYLEYGYIPMEDSVPYAFHQKEQVSRTLEYAFDDYALSVVAKRLGKEKDSRELSSRALNYRNIFDRTVGMMRGKHADGRWYHSFHADKREIYITEGTPRQYSFYVPHDIPGLAKLMGGAKKLETALDSLFLKNEYWHGNEPGHQIPFLYNYTSAPWKTQLQVNKLLSEEYSDGPGGLSGNDDAGQMSAWYLFAAIGFYPVNPVPGEYQITTPLFEKITLQLPQNKKFEVKAIKKSEQHIYVSSITLNGKRYNKNYLNYTDIMKGGILEFQLNNKPTRWGAGIASRVNNLN